MQVCFWEKALPFFYTSAGQEALPRWVLRVTMTAPSADERNTLPKGAPSASSPAKEQTKSQDPLYAAAGLCTSLKSQRTQRFATAATVTLGAFPFARKRAASSFQRLSVRIKR